ncbi:hypothetical protein [Sphingomonas sp. NFR15]|uniref:hypothetical protein n=1 Tax=Sphingomonas sp. NFR15 TaxID=1566282 RepID=UPI0015A24CB8|nr:hypothetical protein [Sphingomonas sp. NFR15]
MLELDRIVRAQDMHSGGGRSTGRGPTAGWRGGRVVFRDREVRDPPRRADGLTYINAIVARDSAPESNFGEVGSLERQD